jgi:hypothetical protein
MLRTTCYKILTLFGITTVLTAIGIGSYIYYDSTHQPLSTQLNLKGILGNDLIFLDLNDDKVSYDTLKRSSINTNYLLNRFFNLDSDYVLVETLLDSNYKQISDWEYIDTNLDTSDLIVSKSGNTLSVDISNIMFDITYYNDIPIKINDYDIVKYNNTGGKINDTIYSYLQNIQNPKVDDIKKINYNITTVIPPNIDTKCLLDLTYKAMVSGKNLVAYGKCGEYNAVGVPGTNFKNIKDIIANINGATFDNYKTGFDNLKNFDFKIYDFCAGYSLGGAIAKFMSLNGYCKNVITFASPLTSKYNMDIPIIQYVNTIDDIDGCCKRDWLGKCITKGMFLVDPVTLIVKGNHENIKYIGNRQNNECVGSFAYTVWKQGFDLHLISSYEPNL